MTSGKSREMYLRPDIQAEPLIDQWYAWAHLIPPATAARNLTHRHIPIMESYIAAPEVHAAAVKNPKMLGGPFIDYNGEHVGEIRDLLQATRAQRGESIALSKAFDDLDRLLQSRAKGESLQPLYPLVPEILRGYVELVYDLYNQASFRLIEPLLYRRYQGQGQSVMLSLTTGDDRPFVLSTPRLPGPGLLPVELPFDSPALDELFTAKVKPAPVEQLADLCGVADKDREFFSKFFTDQPPRPYVRYSGRGVRWRYFGHACILLETPKMSLLFDPVLSYTYESAISRYTYQDLPDWIDYVLITHNHQDHVLFETLIQLRHKIGCIIVPRNGTPTLADPSLKLTLHAAGFHNVRELSELEMIELESGSLMGLPFLGEHCDLNIQTKIAYLLDLNGHKLLFAADSCNIEPYLYKHLQKEIGDIRALFLGMECDGAPGSWLYGPLYSRRLDRAHDQSRRLNGSNYDQGMAIVNSFNCRETFVYAMGQEPWMNYVMSLKYTPDSNPIVHSDKLIQTCRSRGIFSERLFGEREMLLDS